MELTRSDHPFINTLEVGGSVDGFFVSRSMQLGSTRRNKPFLIFDFTDKTGHIKGKLWDDAEAAYRLLEVGQVVKVRAIVEEYQGQAELKIVRIRTVDTDMDDMSRFLPDSGRNPEEDWAVIREVVARMEHLGLKALLENLLDDENFVQQYQLTPAGKKWHHAYLGGLLEHSASITALAEAVCEHFDYLNRDLLVAAAILHDVGKIWELSCDTMIDYTSRGRLIGHIVLGAEFIRRRGEEIDELDEETLTLLEHLVLSHQGKRENSSPIVPMTREAFVLYHLDEIDSKLNAIGRELEKASGGGGPFTGYIKLLDRMLYKGDGFPEEESDSSLDEEEEQPDGEDGK